MDSLYELDANEWWDVYRIFKPDATRGEFERDWREFQQAKKLHIAVQ